MSRNLWIHASSRSGLGEVGQRSVNLWKPHLRELGSLKTTGITVPRNSHTSVSLLGDQTGFQVNPGKQRERKTSSRGCIYQSLGHWDLGPSSFPSLDKGKSSNSNPPPVILSSQDWRGGEKQENHKCLLNSQGRCPDSFRGSDCISTENHCMLCWFSRPPHANKAQFMGALFT